MRYGFIGLGNMASAIIRGMLRGGLCAPNDIYGYDVNPETAGPLQADTGISLASGLKDVTAADVVILCVKPQALGGVLADIKALSLTGKLFISIAAGKDLAFLLAGLGENTPVIRVMPNINAKVGAATSAYAANSHARGEHKAIVSRLFSSVGTVMELPEALFSVFSALAGAAPAFCYLYIDALARAGVRGGMPRKLALEAAASTVLGSAKMILESGEHPFELIDQVSSPGGTTVEGICALQRLGFESAVHQAVEAVVNKDKSL